LEETTSEDLHQKSLFRPFRRDLLWKIPQRPPSEGISFGRDPFRKENY
jgi:hypothetical protein